MAPLPRRSPRNHPPSTAPDPAARRKQKVTKKPATQTPRNTASQRSRPAAERAAAVAPKKQSAIQDLLDTAIQTLPIGKDATQDELSSRSSLKKRSATDLEAAAQYLDRPPTFKRVCLSLEHYCAPLQDGSSYNHVSPTALAVRRMAHEAEAQSLREVVNRLSKENEHLSSQQRNQEEVEASLLESNLERASLQKQLLDVQAQKDHIEGETQSAMEQFRKEQRDLEVNNNASIANLQTARDDLEVVGREQEARIASLLRQVEVETEARLRAEQERDAAATALASEQTPSRDASAEFELNERIAALIAEKQQLQNAAEVAQASSDDYTRKASESDADRKMLESEIATIKSEYERWRGQTIPPTVTPRGQITPSPVKPQEPRMHPLDYKLMRDAPSLYAHMMADMERNASGDDDESDEDDDVTEKDRIIAETWAKKLEDSNKIREEHHEEYMAAQTDFEAGRHNVLPVGKVLYDFREKSWVSFSKAPDGRIRRSAVYAVQLEFENTSVHVLPFKGTHRVTRSSNGSYATACLNAQSPELQAAAAKEFLSKEEYGDFMKRSFGPDWLDLNLANTDIQAEARQQILQDLRTSKRFKTACRMWAAEEPALNQDRCWPPTFLSMEKTQACTHFNDEEERTRIETSCLPGTRRETVQPFYIDEPRVEQLD